MLCFANRGITSNNVSRGINAVTNPAIVVEFSAVSPWYRILIRLRSQKCKQKTIQLIQVKEQKLTSFYLETVTWL